MANQLTNNDYLILRVLQACQQDMSEPCPQYIIDYAIEAELIDHNKKILQRGYLLLSKHIDHTYDVLEIILGKLNLIKYNTFLTGSTFFIPCYGSNDRIYRIFNFLFYLGIVYKPDKIREGEYKATMTEVGQRLFSHLSRKKESQLKFTPKVNPENQPISSKELYFYSKIKQLVRNNWIKYVISVAVLLTLLLLGYKVTLSSNFQWGPFDFSRQQKEGVNHRDQVIINNSINITNSELKHKSVTQTPTPSLTPNIRFK